MARLYYQGHGSYRITAKDGTVLYVDPYAGDGYDLPADLVLVTHQHFDHNQADKMPHKPGCTVITEKEALAGGRHNRFSSHGVEVQAVTAQNQNHNPGCCVGYLLEVDGVKLYAAGDTSATSEMDAMARMKLDWAFLPADGVYNMDVREASRCAQRIAARHSVPVHMKPGGLFSRTVAEQFDAPGKVILEPGQEIEL